MPDTMNEKPPETKYVATKHKTSRTKMAAQRLLNSKREKNSTGIKDEEPKWHHISQGQCGSWDTTRQCRPHSEGK